MTTIDRPSIDPSPEDPSPNDPSRRLVAWPISLVAMTIGLILMANLLSACGRHRGERDIEDVKDHASHAVEHVLERVDATDDQVERIQAIVADGLDELAAAHGPKQDRHAELKEILTAETIDRDAMEAIRRRHLAKADEMTLIASNRLGEILEILTPEQRVQLADRLEKHRDRHRRWH